MWYWDGPFNQPDVLCEGLEPDWQNQSCGKKCMFHLITFRKYGLNVDTPIQQLAWFLTTHIRFQVVQIGI
tara:strand:+ start:27753 stop:27962 length:210 start_codon:yes stop_codon:yes gene_type:complete